MNALSLEAGNQLLEGVNFGEVVPNMNTQIKEEDLNEKKNIRS